MIKPMGSAWNTSPPSSARSQMPRFELKQLSRHGAVFSSATAYEPGTSFAFGIHLPCAGRHRLMNLEAIVADCHATGGGAELGWEVTLIFESMSPAQLTALQDASVSFPLHGSFFGSSRGFREPGLN